MAKRKRQPKAERVMDEAMVEAIFENQPLQFDEIVVRVDDFDMKEGGTLKVWRMDAWMAQGPPAATAPLESMDVAGAMIRNFIATGTLA